MVIVIFKDSVKVMDKFRVKMNLGLGLGSGIKLGQELRLGLGYVILAVIRVGLELWQG